MSVFVGYTAVYGTYGAYTGGNVGIMQYEFVCRFVKICINESRRERIFMKKVLLSLLVLLFIVPMRGNCAENSRYLYTVVNGRAIITGYEGNPEFLEIPQVIDNCTVTETADNAFYGCRSLRRVILPPTMRKIGDHCFYACSSLEQAILPDGLEKLGDSAFCGCTSLEHIILPDSLHELSDSCFRACPALKEVNFPSGVRKIGGYAFSGCTGLEKVTFGDELSEIGERAFFMCGRLSEMYIPSSITRLAPESVGYVPSNHGAAPMQGFILSGRKNTEVQRYAEQSGITFKPSNDIIRRSSLFHPSKKSQQISEVCILIAFTVFVLTVSGKKTALSR